MGKFKNSKEYIDFLNSRVVNSKNPMSKEEIEDFRSSRISNIHGDVEKIDVLVGNESGLIDEKDIRVINGRKYFESYINPDAKRSYEKMKEYFYKKYGIVLDINDAYRSYEYQQKVYDYFVKTKGQEYTDKYVARPGESEHHTGLSLDIKARKPMPKCFPNKPIVRRVFNRLTIPISYHLLWKKSPDFGFIRRYEKGKEDITGVYPEAWHYRYVGEDVAKFMREKNLSLEEYVEMQNSGK